MTSRYHLTVDQLPLSARARLVVDSLVQEARAAIHSGDEQEHRFLLCNSDNETVLVLRPDEFDGTNQDAKERFVADIRRQAQTMEADMVIMLCEGWQRPQGVSEEEYAALKKRHGKTENIPGVEETLIVRIETTATVLGASAHITGKGSTRRCAPVLFFEMSAAEIEREKAAIFSQLVPSQEQIAIMTDTLARAEKLFVMQGINPHRKIFRRSLLENMELMLWTVPGYRMPDDRLEAAVKAVIRMPGL